MQRAGCPPSESISAYRNNSLAPAEREALEQHLARCEFCTAEVDAVDRADRMGDPAAPEPPRGAAAWWFSKPIGMAVAAVVALIVVVGLGRDYYRYAVGDLKRQQKLEQSGLVKMPGHTNVAEAPASAGSQPARDPEGYVAGPLAPPEIANDMSWVRAIVKPPDGLVEWRIGTGGRIIRQLGKKPPRIESSGVTSVLVAGSAPSISICWLVGDNGVVLRTIDGQTWQRVSSPTIGNLVAVSARDSESATIVAAGLKKYLTTDGGQTWWAGK